MVLATMAAARRLGAGDGPGPPSWPLSTVNETDPDAAANAVKLLRTRPKILGRLDHVFLSPCAPKRFCRTAPGPVLEHFGRAALTLTRHTAGRGLRLDCERRVGSSTRAGPRTEFVTPAGRTLCYDPVLWPEHTGPVKLWVLGEYIVSNFLNPQQ